MQRVWRGKMSEIQCNARSCLQANQLVASQATCSTVHIQLVSVFQLDTDPLIALIAKPVMMAIDSVHLF